MPWKDRRDYSEVRLRFGGCAILGGKLKRLQPLWCDGVEKGVIHSRKEEPRYGISCGNYAAAAEAIPGAIGLSSSTVSRAFVTASAAKLKEFQERELGGERYVALFLDGKSFAGR